MYVFELITATILILDKPVMNYSARQLKKKTIKKATITSIITQQQLFL